MPAYLKLGKIEGSVTAEGYENWIECQSFQWGVGKGVSTPTGSAKDRACSTASISEVVVSKMFDKASIALFKNAVAGMDKAQDAKIHLCQSDGTKIGPYVQYELTNTLISGYSVSSGGDRPSESVSLNFTKVQIKFTEGDAAASEANPVVAGFDIATGKPI